MSRFMLGIIIGLKAMFFGAIVAAVYGCLVLVYGWFHAQFFSTGEYFWTIVKIITVIFALNGFYFGCKIAVKNTLNKN